MEMSQLEHPFAWLQLDALDHNIRFVNEVCEDKPVRIATKSIRSVSALRYIQQKLTHCSGLMTFTAAETLYLIEQGFDQLLLGYPVMEAQAVKKLLHHVKAGVDVTFMVDDVAHLTFLDGLSQEIGVICPICIDLNMSSSFPFVYFGTKRSPLDTFEKVASFLEKLKDFSAIKVVGVMGYDAQIAGVGDHYNGVSGKVKSLLMKNLKGKSLQSLQSFRQQAVAHVKAFHDVGFVNGGGSGSMQLTAAQREVTEITVGSAFFAPALFDHYESLTLQPAAGFALRVVRKFSADTFVLQGGGYIASGATGKDRLPQFMEAERFSFLALEGAGEVQSPIVDRESKLQIGDTVYMRHAKAGELCERFMTLQCFRADAYVGSFSTYRGDGQCFL